MALFEHGYALLIGVNENNVSGWMLPVVAKDITALNRVLTDPELCAYPPAQVKTVTGKSATRQGILDGLDWLQEQLHNDPSGNATAIIHYSGHGWRDERSQPTRYYLIPYDVRQDNVRSHALRAEDFADGVAAVNPRRLLVTIDCCHSGGMDVRDIQPAEGLSPAAIPTGLLINSPQAIPASDGIRGLESLGRGHGRAVLSASQGDQSSYNRRDGKMGIFTYHLIEALTGHARPQEGASEVLVSDVMSYVWRRVPASAQADWGKEQQPDYQVSGNFPLALLFGGRGLNPGQVPSDPLENTRSIGVASPGMVNLGGGDYIGGNKTTYGDEVLGNKMGGDNFNVGPVSGTGIVIGRNSRATVNMGSSVTNLEELFAPVYHILSQAPAEKREQAVHLTEALQHEAEKGDKAEDSRMAKLIDNLVELVPAAVSAVVNTFATPILAGIVGPVTKYVIERFKRPE